MTFIYTGAGLSQCVRGCYKILESFTRSLSAGWEITNGYPPHAVTIWLERHTGWGTVGVQHHPLRRLFTFLPVDLRSRMFGSFHLDSGG